MSFTAWVQTQVGREDAVGDLARWHGVDRNWPSAASALVLRPHIEAVAPHLVEAFDQAWAEFTDHAEEQGDRAWPPFEPGNQAALRHGASSPRRVAPIAAELADAIVEAAPWCGHAAFLPEVEAFAWATAQARLLRGWLDEHALIDGTTHEARAGVLQELHRCETRAAKTRQALGLNPVAWAKVLGGYREVEGPASDMTKSVEAVGREILEARAATAAVEVAQAAAGPDAVPVLGDQTEEVTDVR